MAGVARSQPRCDPRASGRTAITRVRGNGTVLGEFSGVFGFAVVLRCRRGRRVLARRGRAARPVTWRGPGGVRPGRCGTGRRAPPGHRPGVARGDRGELRGTPGGPGTWGPGRQRGAELPAPVAVGSGLGARGSGLRTRWPTRSVAERVARWVVAPPSGGSSAHPVGAAIGGEQRVGSRTPRGRAVGGGRGWPRAGPVGGVGRAGRTRVTKRAPGGALWWCGVRPKGFEPLTL